MRGRKDFCGLLCVLCVLCGSFLLLLPGCELASVPSDASKYPAKSLTIICPWAAGGGTDRIARFWADALQHELGQPVIVVNKTGGSGATGHLAGARARADGYTLTLITFELSTMHHMGISPLTYQDYRCLMQVNADAAAILVREDSPWKTLPELLDHVRSQPGKLRMSGTASGGAWDLARAGLLQAAELPLEAVTWVPSKGSAPSLVELLGGHVDAVCCSIPEAADAIDSGRLRVLAVMAEERLPEYPDVPTVKEQGIDWVAVGWRGLALPRDTPDAIVQKLNDSCRKIAGSPAFREFMEKNGFTIVLRESGEFERFLAEQDAQWREVVEAAGYAP